MPIRYDLTPGQAAELIGVHIATIRRWADDGTLKVFRSPNGSRRFSRADIEAFIAEHTNQPEPTEASA